MASCAVNDNYYQLVGEEATLDTAHASVIDEGSLQSSS